MQTLLNRPAIQLVLIWCLVIAAKLWYRQAEVTETDFLLAPTATISGMLMDLSFESQPLGYHCLRAGILISQDCSGFNFLMVATLAAFFALSPRWSQSRWLIPLSVVLAYALTILANVARICCLIVAGSLTPVPGWLHLSIGIIVYLCLLIPFSLLLSKNPILLPHENRNN
jgi:exosortase K